MVTSAGARLTATAKSTGGGTFAISTLNGETVSIFGKHHELVVFCAGNAVERVRELGMAARSVRCSVPDAQGATLSAVGAPTVVQFSDGEAFPDDVVAAMRLLDGVSGVMTCAPVYHVQKGAALFGCAAEMCWNMPQSAVLGPWWNCRTFILRRRRLGRASKGDTGSCHPGLGLLLETED